MSYLIDRVRDFCHARASHPEPEVQSVSSAAVSTRRYLKSQKVPNQAFIVTSATLTSSVAASTLASVSLDVGSREIGSFSAKANTDYAGVNLSSFNLGSVELPAPIVILPGSTLQASLYATAGYSAASVLYLHGLRVDPEIAKEWLELEGELRIYELYHDDDNLVAQLDSFRQRGELTHRWLGDYASNIDDFHSCVQKLDSASRCGGAMALRAVDDLAAYSGGITSISSKVSVNFQKSDTFHSTVQGGDSSATYFHFLGREYS